MFSFTFVCYVFKKKLFQMWEMKQMLWHGSFVLLHWVQWICALPDDVSAHYLNLAFHHNPHLEVLSWCLLAFRSQHTKQRICYQSAASVLLFVLSLSPSEWGALGVVSSCPGAGRDLGWGLRYFQWVVIIKQGRMFVIQLLDMKWRLLLVQDFSEAGWHLP